MISLISQVDRLLIQVFVDKIREFQPSVVGLSGFLTLAFDSMKASWRALEKAGLRDNVKIMIGGGQMDDEVRKYVRADAYGRCCGSGKSLQTVDWIGGSQWD